MLATAWLAAACEPHRTAVPVAIALEWHLRPRVPVVGRALLHLVLTDRATGQPVHGAEVRIEASMTHPGMAPFFARARELAPGTYEAALELTMAGDWLLLLEARLRDGRTLRRQLPVPGVRPA